MIPAMTAEFSSHAAPRSRLPQLIVVIVVVIAALAIGAVVFAMRHTQSAKPATGPDYRNADTLSAAVKAQAQAYVNDPAKNGGIKNLNAVVTHVECVPTGQLAFACQIIDTELGQEHSTTAHIQVKPDGSGFIATD